MRKILLISVPVLVLIFGGYIYWKYYYIFGEGVKSGYLNYVVYKGDVFKTYEGKLIQEGFGRSKTGAVLQSHEFEFSIESEEIFNELKTKSGKYVDLHYKEYHGKLPWRGHSVYIVDKIENVRE